MFPSPLSLAGKTVFAEYPFETDKDMHHSDV